MRCAKCGNDTFSLGLRDWPVCALCGVPAARDASTMLRIEPCPDCGNAQHFFPAARNVRCAGCGKGRRLDAPTPKALPAGPAYGYQCAACGSKDWRVNAVGNPACSRCGASMLQIGVRAESDQGAGRRFCGADLGPVLHVNADDASTEDRHGDNRLTTNLHRGVSSDPGVADAGGYDRAYLLARLPAMLAGEYDRGLGVGTLRLGWDTAYSRGVLRAALRR